MDKDIFSEANGDSKAIFYRHTITTEKSIPIKNIATNTSKLLCQTYTIQPDFGTYLAGNYY